MISSNLINSSNLEEQELDHLPKLIISLPKKRFYSINYLSHFQCESPDCLHQTYTPPYCPAHLKHCYNVTIDSKTNQLTTARSDLDPVVPEHPTTAFWTGDLICLFGRAEGSNINPNSTNCFDLTKTDHRLALREIYGSPRPGIYSIQVDSQKVYDCSLIRYPGIHAQRNPSPKVANAKIHLTEEGDCWLRATRRIDYDQQIILNLPRPISAEYRHQITTTIPKWFIQLLHQTEEATDRQKGHHHHDPDRSPINHTCTS